MAIKKWFTLIVFFLLTMSFAQAEELYTTVQNVIESVRTEKLLVLSGADGKVYKTGKKTEDSVKYYKSFIGQVVKLTYSVSGKDLLISNIQRTTPAEADPAVFDLNHFEFNTKRSFTPTNLTTEQANHAFTSMLNDGDKSRSQCFKRAHIWSFDLWSKMKINSEKVFIFYTQRQIQLEENEWWFHVAPLVTVNGEAVVLDGTFMDKPTPLKAWKDFFIKSKMINCPIAKNYDEYTKNQWTKLCYLMKVPMYHLSPLDIENRDTKNIQRNHWVLEELQDARRAFKGYMESYEGLDTGKPNVTF